MTTDLGKAVQTYAGPYFVAAWKAADRRWETAEFRLFRSAKERVCEEEKRGATMGYVKHSHTEEVVWSFSRGTFSRKDGGPRMGLRDETVKGMGLDADTVIEEFKDESNLSHDIAIHCKALIWERERLREGLKMIAQIIHGSTRVTRMLAEATLDGADLTDEDTAIEVCEGSWKPPTTTKEE